MGRRPAAQRALDRSDPLRIDPVAALVFAACAIAVVGCAYYGARANSWAVMTDELQVARLATSIADSLSPIPTIRGEYYAAHSQLYPLLLAPFYGTLDPPHAVAAAHVLNALLLVSAAIPAFLLARSVTGAPLAGWVAAALTALTPWLVLSTTLLTENAAYPAFAWAVLLCHRALVHPSPGRDAVALAGLVLAFFARTQLFVVALALPIAVALLALRQQGRSRAALTETVRQHRVLAGAYGVGILAAAALLALGSLGGLVGNYTVPFEGDLLPAGFARAAAEHFVQVTLGVGVLPIVLTLSWLTTTALFSARLEERAFAALVIVLAPLLLFQVTSFDLRFTPEQFIQDRYLAYLAPLVAVGSVAWASQRGAGQRRVVATLGAGALVGSALRYAPTEEIVIFWASPAAAFRPAIAAAAGWLGVAEVTLLEIATTALVVATAAAAWRLSSRVLLRAALVVAVFGALQAIYVFTRFAEPSLVRGGAEPRNWIDQAVPPGGSVTLVPGGATGPVPWWEAEYWNLSVTRELRVDDGPVHTPFPVLAASTDVQRGRLSAPEASEYLVLADDEARFGPVETAELARKSPLRLVRVQQPYRMAWATRGLTDDGWMRPRKPATVHVFGSERTEQRALRITLAASERSPRPVPFVVRGPQIEVRDTVGPGGARPPLEVSVCVPAKGSTEVHVVGGQGAVLEDGRRVSLHVERIELSEPWPCEAS